MLGCGCDGTFKTWEDEFHLEGIAAIFWTALIWNSPLETLKHRTAIRLIDYLRIGNCGGAVWSFLFNFLKPTIWHWQPPFTGVQRWGGQTASKDPLFNSFRNYFRLFSWVQHHECPPGQPVWKSARYPLLYKWLSNLTSHLFAKVSFSPHLQCGHSRKL